MKATQQKFRHIAAALVTMNLFCNHWSRDSVGALEIPLETKFGFSVMVHIPKELPCANFRLPEGLRALCFGR